MTVRPSTDDDWSAVLEVHRRAFGGEVEPRMADAVRASDGWVPELSLVAEADGAVAGHALTSRVGLRGSRRRLLQTGPLGVLPEHQGRGIGSALMRATLERARALGEPLVLVEGDPAFYGRFGFVRADELGLLPPPEARYDWAFQVAVLDDEAELPRGRVVYPRTFPS
ncbi:MAG TPA: N-acetyltransferase [Gaiellaceae bacterium]|nr:N-acetyltransferase [Gaiellaceae bacterium]